MNFDFLFMFDAMRQILPAVPLTLTITGSAMLFGLVLALLLMYMQQSKLRALHWLRSAYISFFRGTPLMLHLLLCYYTLPIVIANIAYLTGWNIHGSDISLSTLAIIALSLNSSSYLAEILRSGFLSIPKGEIEASLSIGMTGWQVFRRIVIPQILINSIPSLGSRLIALLHGSSLAFWIAVTEITGKANLVAASTYQFVEAFIAAAAIYWILTLLIERIVALLERRYARIIPRGIQ